MATHHTGRPVASKRVLSAHVRPSKPSAPLSRRTHSRASSKYTVQHKDDDDEWDDDTVMAASFLQYCTTCEKQIVVPSNFVLYCSESCKKQDNNKQLPHPADYSPQMTGFNSPIDDQQFHDIVQPRSPTTPSTKRSSCVFSELSSDGNATLNEEKAGDESEASRYLRQFRSGTASSETTVRPHRPRYNRASISHATFSTTPSLSHTPASSLSLSLPYTPSTRPLPPRTQSSSHASKSADLVIPYGTTGSSFPHCSLKSAPLSVTSTGNVEGEILYEKSPIPSVTSAGGGALRQLFESTPQ